MTLFLDRLLLRMTYRYELLLGGVVLTLVFWPMYAGLQGFMAAFTVLLVLLDARSTSQFKRNVEDATMLDVLLGRIPFRYEVLCLIAVVLWLLWWLTAGVTGFVLGLGIVMLAVRARSSSQLKRGTALTLQDA
ncbi:hypothetical protein [Deinococcus ruber]|uniref:Uncharacterized protein n=1 Tax=Deinococcus ruber TaxID=1848197 RepID=A0A918CCL8_9DEIO|nr:hypothetical protein [Deinococcus ruber]GGR15610.1 hypothetical protein GCM10008957_30440 [Deinococcus ruber]